MKSDLKVFAGYLVIGGCVSHITGNLDFFWMVPLGGLGILMICWGLDDRTMGR